MLFRFRTLPWIAVIAVVGLGIARLRFDIEVLNLLPPDIPAVQGLKLYQEHFSNARELVITVRAPDAESAEHAARVTAERLRPATDLIGQVVWQPPWQEHPDQAAELIASLWFNQPEHVFSQLTNRFEPVAAAQLLADAREQLATSMSPGDIARLSYDPFGLTELPENVSGAAPSFGEGEDIFSSADGTFRILFVQPARALGSYRDSASWLDAVRERVERARADGELPADVKIGFTGGPAFVSEISSGMEGDLQKSVGATVVVVVLLFWWAHRRLKPLLWLLGMLGLILCGTLGLGGLILGTVNVVSVGFAAILVGLAVDYGLVLYHEAIHGREVSLRQTRRAVAPGIIWSAITTASAFLVLNLGGLPGLGQLGTLVGIGVGVAALVMLNIFLQPFLVGSRAESQGSARDTAGAGEVSSQSAAQGTDAPYPENHSRVAAWTATALIAFCCIVVLSQTRPPLDRTTDALRPKNSPAYAAMDEIKRNIAGEVEPDWLLISGENESALASKLKEVEPVLNRAVSNHLITSFTLPVAVLPSVENQAANRVAAARTANGRDALRDVVRNAGFTSNAMAFTEGVLNTWQRAASDNSPFWPTNFVSRWVLDKVSARGPDGFYALGLVHSVTNATHSAADWTTALPQEGVWLAGWQRLGSDLLDVVEEDFPRVLAIMGALLLVTLWLAFKRFTEVFLSLAAFLFSGLCLWTVMAVLGWSWNLLNLLALPLLLGIGLDYSIHMQLALRRHRGDLRRTRHTIGRALLLCGGTTVAGFGSNAWSSNAGLASLGLVCAAGVAITACTCVGLLPIWWRTLQPGLREGMLETKPPSVDPPPGVAASSLYRPELWRAGLGIVRVMPRRVCVPLARVCATLYWALAPHRRRIVIQNLLPAVGNDRVAAARKARHLFQQFAVKLVDLWLYEAGMPIEKLLGEASGWEHFAAAQSQNRGVLLLTPHLGNWEFGGPWLTRRGVSLQVITLAEPGENFTELRRASRARRNIETLVIGNDPFAFLEIIRRLESGATVALLIDRPPAATAIDVELFGRSFGASVAAAELARASGCVLLPVYMPKTAQGYAAHILPAIDYARETLRDRAARQRLTQDIMRAFEPAIRQYADQWYHFVPVWPQ